MDSNWSLAHAKRDCTDSRMMASGLAASAANKKPPAKLGMITQWFPYCFCFTATSRRVTNSLWLLVSYSAINAYSIRAPLGS